MYRSFLNARSPMRLFERGLHGGLGAGNLGAVLAGHGVGKTSFLVGVALDDLLRGKPVLHVCLDHSVSHVREHYDTVFEELAKSVHLEDAPAIRAEIDRRRSIRVYSAGEFSARKVREALELVPGGSPAVLLIDGLDLARESREDLCELRAAAGEIGAEAWLAVASEGEQLGSLPEPVRRVEDLLSVILVLEPEAGVVKLRALKEHDNPDVSELHVALDPHTLLLVRS